MAVIRSKKRKVLIVSFLFPPAGTIGAVRVGKFAKYLPQFGWEPIVLTANRVKGLPETLPVEIDKASIIRTPYFALAPFIRHSLIGNDNVSSHEISSGPGWRHKAYRLIRLMRAIYSRSEVSFFINEPWGWYRPAVKKGLEIVSKQKIDVIFSSYGPSTSHLVAARLQAKTGIPWVAEFRDPWSSNPYRHNVQPFHFVERQIERKVMKGCSLLITVSESWAREIEALHSKKVITVHNGFDEEDYIEDAPLTSKFTITYTGNIYSGKRDPTPLFKAIAELSQEGKISPSDLEVCFFGSNVIETLSPLVKKYSLLDFVKIYGFVPFKESVERQKESTALLLLSWNDPRDKGTLAAKVFEYLGAGRPILAIAFKSGEIDQLLARSGSGIVATGVEEIKEILLKWLDEFKRYGNISSYYSPKPEVIRKYSRREQTRKLAQLLVEVSASKKSDSHQSVA